MQQNNDNYGYRQPFTAVTPLGFLGQILGIPQAIYGRPPYGPPGRPPLGPGGPAQPGSPQSGPPPGAPPSFIPSQTAAQQGPGVLAVDPGALSPCRFRFTYLWLDNGQQFWAWIVFVGPRSIAGWRWIGFRWVYFGTDINRIVSFVCY